MSARRITTFLAAAGALCAAAATAGPATAATYPSISKVTPMQVRIGGTLTITGKGFLKGKGKNTVVFRRVGKRSIFAKADGLTTTRLRVVVPEKLAPVMGKRDGAAVASKFQLRVLARRFGKSYTAIKLSPTILPAAAAPAVTPLAAPAPVAATPAPTPAPPVDTDGDGTPDVTDEDDDNDLLPDATEWTIGTDPLNRDTDGDGMEDGWEYTSAKDLNTPSCLSTADYPEPCPGLHLDPASNRQPNPLNPDDVDKDYDGDWLSTSLEHKLWVRTWKLDPSYRAISGPKSMWYSAGKQASVEEVVGNGCRGAAVPTPLGGPGPEYRVYSLDRGGRTAYDGCLDDGERDADGDYLGNQVEDSGPLSENPWWAGNFTGDVTYWWVDFTGTDPANPDTDGDGILDGLDDQDFDDFWNIEETVRGPQSADKEGNLLSARNGLWVQPFNPCLPSINARTCPQKLPLNGDIWSPFTPPDADDPVVPRWPLYGTALYGTEVWDGAGKATPMPPATTDPSGTIVTHPIPRPLPLGW